MTINEITGLIIQVSIEIHRKFGPGLLESVYEALLAHELRKRGVLVEIQLALPVIYEEVKLDIGFRLDMLVEKTVIVEIKSVESLAPVHFKQLLTYLRLTKLRVGLLINFNEELLKDGIKRVINGYE